MDREKLREARAIARWAHLDKKSGTGNSTVQVTVDAYSGRNARNTSVQVATNGGVSKNVSVVQMVKQSTSPRNQILMWKLLLLLLL